MSFFSSKFLPLQTFQPLASFYFSGDNLALCPTHDNDIFLSRLAPSRRLAYCNSRFCFLKYTKPAHEHNLQGVSVTSASLLLYNVITIQSKSYCRLTRVHSAKPLSRYLQVMAQNFWLIRVSRYKADGEQVKYHLIVILLTALERSGYTFSS